MTGIGMAAASGKGAATSSFSASIQLVGGSSFNVSGASGDIYSQGGAVISIVASGGTLPYFFFPGLTKDGGTGSVSVVASGDGIHNTVGWSGMSVGDTVLFHFDWTAHDSGTPQQNDGGRNPSGATVYGITRTS